MPHAYIAAPLAADPIGRLTLGVNDARTPDAQAEQAIMNYYNCEPVFFED